MRIRSTLWTTVVALLLAPSAAAHVTLNPREWEAGAFARFAVRVPNERPNASTTKVTVQFPESVISASFQPVPGWKRTVKMAPLAEPIEEEGEQITERLASVTWSGGTIRPGEFQEFGVSFQVPETVGEELVFPSLQTYSNGEVVRWIAPDPEADTPAPRIAVLPPEEEETPAAAETTEGSGGAEAEATAPATADDDGRANLALAFGIAGLAAGLSALALALVRMRRSP